MQEALAINPDNGVTYANLADEYIGLNRLDEARATVDRTRSRKIDYPGLHEVLSPRASFATTSPVCRTNSTGPLESKELKANCSYAGQIPKPFTGALRKSQEFTGRAWSPAKRDQENETAAFYQARSAHIEAEIGNSTEARQQANAASYHPQGFSSSLLRFKR